MRAVTKKILKAAAGLAVVAVVVFAAVLCAVFPNKYAKELNAAADSFGLDRSFVRAVVWAESGFDRRAVSPKGAIGLMQLMPDTFAECAAALGIPTADPLDASANLACGCYYLKKMLDVCGTKKAALYAYNAGENNAKKFLKGETVFPETEKYVKRVQAAERFYGLFD